MYNTEKPAAADLPSSKQLIRSTLIALVAAIAILVTIVLPAEYSIDPTGIGRVLGLTEMGEIKGQLAKEAAADAAMDAAKAQGKATAATSSSQDSPQSEANAAWRDEMKVSLQPGQGAEVKLVMQAGDKAQFSWVTEGGVVNFDKHGDGGAESISYEKGRGASFNEGDLEAAFTGNHGWFWRNRGESPVTITIRTRGQYAEMKRVL
jgi:hypothetical protein